MPRYGVSKTFRTKRAAQKWAKAQRKAGYGAQIDKLAKGYMVRRTDRLLRK